MQSLTAVFTVGRDKKEGVEMQRLSRNWVKAFFMPFPLVPSLIQHLRIED